MNPQEKKAAHQPVPPLEAPPLVGIDGGAAPDNNGPLPAFTLLTSDSDFLTKSISLVDGKLHKIACAQPRSANAQTHVVAGLVDFAEFLDSLEPTQALVYGVMIGRTEARIVTESKRSKHPNVISRTRQFFQFAPQPGVMMFDHDGMEGGRPIAPEELHELLIAAAPALASVQMLWRPSASSGIVGPDGTPMTQLIGQRFYVIVDDASLIPEAGKAIWDLLWAAREGWVGIGKAGQKLQRAPVDKSVWQPERLDFAAPPVVKAPLTRSPTPWRIFGEGVVSSRDLPVPHRHGRPSRQYDDAASAVTLCRWLSLLLSARSRATGAIRRRTGWCWIVSPGTARPGGSATRRLWHRGARA